MDHPRKPHVHASPVPSEIAFHSILPSLAAQHAQSGYGAIPSLHLFILLVGWHHCGRDIRLFGNISVQWWVVANRSVEPTDRETPKTGRVRNNGALTT